MAISFTTRQLSDLVHGSLSGPDDLVIDGVEQVDRACPGQLTFIGLPRYAARWPSSGATAALVAERIELEPGAGRAFIRVPDTDLALATVLEAFTPPPVSPVLGVHPRAVVEPEAEIGDGVSIGALSYVGPRVRIGDGTVIHPNVTVLADSTIGASCTLWPGVVVRERCTIGDGCILHPNATVGADGFGFRPAPHGRSLVKIPHIGTVTLGRAVEIGAGSCVDRGKFSETSIGDGTKIDNLVQIGHNCHIGRSTVVVSIVGIGGSTTIGDGVMIGGDCSISDHLTIGDGARLAGGSGLMNDIPAGETWQGRPAQNAKASFREYAAIRKLPGLLREMKRASRVDERREA